MIGSPSSRRDPQLGAPVVSRGVFTAAYRSVSGIVSFLLQTNEISAGETELPPELAPLEEILFTERPAR